MLNRTRQDQLMMELIPELEKAPQILALYQCGSAAFDRMDEWSDIDLILLAQDGTIPEVFRAVDRAVSARHRLKATLGETEAGWPGVWQKTYLLADESPYHLFEVAVIQADAATTFTEPEIHGDVRIFFDKVGFTHKRAVDLKDFAQRMRRRFEHLAVRTTIYQILPKKELHRGNLMEAHAFYYQYLLMPYLEMLRMLHDPFRFNFGARYVHYDLPPEEIAALQRLFFVPDADALRECVQEVLLRTANLTERLRSLDFYIHVQNAKRTA